MPWTTPTKRNAGEAILASDQQVWVDDLMMGHPVFATAADRDAAITSPSEGQMAYLSAPAAATVTATGAATAVPSGITTIYNGSAWVCTTPVGANATGNGTTSSTSYVTTLTSDGTAISATLPTGTSALIHMSAHGYNGLANSAFWVTFSVSGATTLAAADGNGVAATIPVNGYSLSIARSYIVTGLTAGVNTFTLNYKTSADTSTYVRRSLVVQGVA